MTLYDLIMGGIKGAFTKSDWSKLGRGLVEDEDTIRKMLMDGYGAVVDEDDV